MGSRVVVVGGGFAGVWSALSAARHLDEVGAGPDKVRVSLVSTDPWLTIRPRLYERSLDGLRVPLDRLLSPVGVERVQGFVTAIDPAEHTVTVRIGDRLAILPYDRLVLAAGSNVQRPPLPGLDSAFTVDTYGEAVQLERHLRAVSSAKGDAGSRHAVVIGAGFTGLEVATDLVGRLRWGSVTMVEAAPEVGPDLGPGPRPFVEEALRHLGIGVRLGEKVVEIDPSGVTLESGDHLPSAVTVWAAGLRANPLAQTLGVPTDVLGRVTVDDDLWVTGAPDVFAAGDVARALAAPGHPTLMSCQHAIPMGKFAGHNAAVSLVGGEFLSYEQPDYVTCLDLGEAGALFTRGWDRTVIHTGPAGKRVKVQINQYDIYPPFTRDRAELFRAARPYSPSLEGLIAVGASDDPLPLRAIA